MPNYFLHLWATPPASLVLDCPPAPPGATNDPTGFFDPGTVDAAYSAAGWGSLVVVLLLVLLCYLLTEMSTGPRFTRRWLLFLVVAAVVCFAVPLGVLRAWPTHSLAGSCELFPDPFPAKLPWNEIVNRALAGLVWGLLAFVIVSVLATRIAGRFPWSGGFFHCRGCPWPRLLRPGGV